MDKFSHKKTLSIENGPTYAYVYSAAEESKPTFLLLHGFPSSAFDWRKTIPDLTKAGYGVIVPDLLGYGDTDKPAALDEYRHSNISLHVAKILDNEGLTSVVAVGHDWGSYLLGRMWNYYPQYFSSLTFMSVPYAPPVPFDLDGLNAMGEAAFGYPTYGYMETMNETDAADIISAHTESFLSLIYPDKPDVWRSDFCPRGKAKEWMTADKKTGLPVWESKGERAYQIKLFEVGGWVGPTNWYKSAIRNIDAEREAQISPANYAITKPVFFVGGDKDYATRIEGMMQLAEQGRQQGWLPNVEVKVVPGGSHWFMLEKPDETFAILDGLAKAV